MPRKNQTKKDLAPLVDGFRISSKDAPAYIKKAYKSWSDQRQRCLNKNDPRYEWWGAKGIRVEYSAYDFVLWWKEQWELKGPFIRPNCSRKDHSKNYTLDNISLLECSENSKERMDRVGPPKNGNKVVAVNMASGISFVFKSSYEASQETGVAKSNILKVLKSVPQRPITTGWVFYPYPPQESI